MTIFFYEKLDVFYFIPKVTLMKITKKISKTSTSLIVMPKHIGMYNIYPKAALLRI